MTSRFPEILKSLDDPHHLDLDELKSAVESAVQQVGDLEQTTKLYELELQREVRAKVDLCGGVTGCPTPESAFELTGQALLAARRDAIRKFNQVFFMAPLSRNAQKT